MFGTVDLGIANDRQRARRKQAAQIAITTLGDAAKLFLATARVLRGHQPDPGRKVPTRSKGFRVGNAGNERGRQSRPNTRYLIQPPTRLIGPMPGHKDRKSTRLNSSHLGISYAVF